MKLQPKLKKIKSKLRSLENFAGRELKEGDEKAKKFLERMDKNLKKLIDKSVPQRKSKKSKSKGKS